MDNQNDSKLRILYLNKILNELTDEDHSLSTTELIKLMEKKYGIHVHRTTISNDIELLKQFGVDIYTIKSTQNKHYVASRLFGSAELKLLIDAVESSKFITAKKSKELVSKLSTFVSTNQAKELKRNISTEGRIKPGNEQIYYIVDAINDAINVGKKISFQYFQYNVRKKQQLRHDGETYVFSPYSLVWNGDYYYVVGYSDKHQNIGSFRVDRIYTQPKILKEDAVVAPEDFDIIKYINTMFRMYNSERQEVELICDNSLMDAVIDRFGQDVSTYAYDMKSFRTVVDIAVNHVFYSWVFGFGGKVKINAPQNTKEEYLAIVKASYDALQDA
jgi:predicted DNA-binding transcriptional regulator YafY